MLRQERIRRDLWRSWDHEERIRGLSTDEYLPPSNAGMRLLLRRSDNCVKVAVWDRDRELESQWIPLQIVLGHLCVSADEIREELEREALLEKARGGSWAPCRR